MSDSDEQKSANPDIATEATPPTRRLQFTLSSMLWATLLLALSCAVFGGGGLIVGPILLAIVAYFRTAALRRRVLKYVAYLRSPASRETALKYALVVLTCIGCLIPLLLPTVGSRESPPLGSCMCNLHWIGSALRNYKKSNGKLPPVRELDSHGKAMLSWRFAILPNLGEGDLVRLYDPTEPWHGPKNRKLAIPILAYHCPANSCAAPMATTDYVAVVGPDGNWLDAEGSSSAKNATKANPVLVIETSVSGIAWMEPRDISLDDLCKTDCHLFASHHVSAGGFFYCDEASGVNVLFRNGSVKSIPPNIPADVLRAVLVGDRSKQDDLGLYRTRNWRINWPNCAALAALVVCFVTMLAWPRRTPAAQ